LRYEGSKPAASGGKPAKPWTRVRSLASAWIRLASTAKPSPPTRPSSMQRCETPTLQRDGKGPRSGPPTRWRPRLDGALIQFAD